MAALRLIVILAGLLLAACAPLPAPPASAPPAREAPVAGTPDGLPDPATAARNFATVLDRMEPVTVSECRRRAPQLNCAFLVVVDTRPGLVPNAFQTVDRSGRPVIGFTATLLAEARNTDELAFILGHEAAHHILGHIPRREDRARTAALILGTLASLGGGDAEVVRNAQQIGAEVAARSYGRELELEADRLGAVLAWLAGFDPVRGAAFFARLPDPGNRFLGTHPPNAERVAVVRSTVAQLGPRPMAGTVR